MPNHWESSARPLFVRTVFVNGNRHAILFERDPLLHYGNSPFKKISRPNSSLSFASDRSLASSDSQDSNSDDRVAKLRDGGQRQRKDLSAELQSCLIKLQLASGNLENGIKSDEEKCFCNSKKAEGSQKEISKQGKHKWKRDKICRRKHCEHFQGESKENKLTGQGANRDSSCYFYNFESSNRKKNYCVVKISSNPPQFTLNCTCNGDLSGAQKCRCFATDKNNMVISATIHNLFMASRKEKLLDSRDDNRLLCESMDSIDLYWNSYLTRSYYNSLSERVFQWMDLVSKRKNQKEKLGSTQEVDSSNRVERIFSGKTFTGESKKTEYSDKSDNKQREKELTKRGSVRHGTTREEVDREVVAEPNVRTVLSGQRLQEDSQKRFEEGATATAPSKLCADPLEESSTDSVPAETTSSDYLSEAHLKGCCRNPPKSPLKIQDLLLEYDFRRNFDISPGKRNTRKIKQTRGFQTFQTKCRRIRDLCSTEDDEEEEEDDEEENVVITPANYWEKRIGKKNNKLDTYDEQTPCHCDRNSDGCTDKIRSQILTESITERNQKPINKLNITRTKPALAENLLSSQQHDEISSLQREKTIWGLEKGTGRPQLHIFMPSLLLREASDDSMSECENLLNFC